MDSNMSPDELVTAMKVACARAHQLQTLCELAGLDPDQTRELEEPRRVVDLQYLGRDPGCVPELELEEPYFWNKEDPLCPRF